MVKKYVNKSIFIILFSMLSFFMVSPNVYARQVEGGQVGGNATNTRTAISVANNDYELVCIYDDGAELTIAKNGVYLKNASNKVDSNSQINFKMFLTSSQTNQYDSNGKLIESRHDKLLSNYKCPTKLYAYSVPTKYDNSSTEEEAKESETINYYYSTKTGIEAEFGTHSTGMWWWKENIPDATRDSAKDANLISEEAYLLSTKDTTICDYKSISTEAISSTQSVSIYLYDNITFLEMGTRITPLSAVKSECPQSLTSDEISKDNPNKKYLYVNDANPQSIGNAGTSSNYYYNSIRYVAVNDKSSCSASNDGKECQKFQFIGSRTGNPDDLIEEDVCKLLGNNTINLLKEVTGWLQILVPALVIILIGLDIAKMVLAGNLDEELPKKKKSIIIRLIIMVFFFFIPLIVGLIIKLLNEAGINIGDIECFFK